MASWQTFSPYSEGAQYEVIEYYAGVGRIARLSSACGDQSTAYDVLYQPGPSNAATGPGPGCGKKVPKGKRVMDLSQPSGFALL